MATCDNNGLKAKLEIERKDWLRIAGFVVGLVGLIMGAVVPLTLYVFQTRHLAIQEHADIEQAAALHAQEAKLRLEFSEKRNTYVSKSLETLHKNQSEIMRERGLRRKIEPLPVAADFDFKELE